jgi:integrase
VIDGHRDRLVGLIIYRHGLRVSEACDLRWDDIDLPKRTIIVRRLKGSTDSVHYLERNDVNGLELLHRQQEADGVKVTYVFINERGQPFGRMGIGSMIERAGEAAGLPFVAFHHQYRALHVARCDHPSPGFQDYFRRNPNEWMDGCILRVSRLKARCISAWPRRSRPGFLSLSLDSSFAQIS